MATQNELALQMLAQLRVLDPSVSAEIGTPERKIIDTVAQALAESQVDLAVLEGALDLDAKFGADLDKFVSIFGFGRQKGTRATGFVTFGRTVASTFDILIRRGTTVTAPAVITDGLNNSLLFTTVTDVTLEAGSLSVIAPVECATVGKSGNVAANQITTFSGTPVLGITSVVNETPTKNGIDPETDEELKVRFKNTIFRNVSGTQDQYLALAVSTQFSTKASVVGPISRYREYVQVPDVSDNDADPDSGVTGNGASGEYTTALSTIPYSKHIYDTIPFFVADDHATPFTTFYRGDTDFILNLASLDKNKGDTYRGWTTDSGLNPLTDTATVYQPNLTFINVFTNTEGDSDSVVAIRPGDVLLFEHSYMSSASRNDWANQVTNCVDVFINGENDQITDTVIAKPPPTTNLFVGDTTHRYYFGNFRRVGEPKHRPLLGNIFTALFLQPVVDLPDTITVGTSVYFKGTHYWAIEDVSELRNTVRSRNGIEWSSNVRGWTGSDAIVGPYTGSTIATNSATAVTINGYTYDKNVIDLQAALEGSKQVTTDVLAHRATSRYLKLDITVMYSPNTSTSDANQAVHDNLVTFLEGQYFGTTIQLSDLLQVIHNTSGIDNCRWSQEILTAQGDTVDTSGNPRDRVVECDVNGNPLRGIVLDRASPGTVSSKEVWHMYYTGSPDGGTFTLTQGEITSVPITLTSNSTTFFAALATGPGPPIGTITGSGSLTDPFVLTFAANGFQTDPIVATTSSLTGGDNVFNGDFFLRDNELPALPDSALSSDTVPGLIIRARAQNTWSQL